MLTHTQKDAEMGGIAAAILVGQDPEVQGPAGADPEAEAVVIPRLVSSSMCVRACICTVVYCICSWLKRS